MIIVQQLSFSLNKTKQIVLQSILWTDLKPSVIGYRGRICTSLVIVGLFLQFATQGAFAQQEGISFRINNDDAIASTFPIISATVSVPCNLISRITENYQAPDNAKVIYDKATKINQLSFMIDLPNQVKPTHTAILLDLWAGTQQNTQDIRKALELGLQVEQSHLSGGRKDTFLLAAPDQSGTELNKLYEGNNDPSSTIAERLNHYIVPNVTTTPLVDLLMKTVSYFGQEGVKSDHQQMIIVFSNGFDTPDDEKLAQLITRTNDLNIQINTIFFDAGSSERVRLEQIAIATGGRAYYLSETPLLSDLWRGVFAVETRCRFGYRTTNKDANSLLVERTQLTAQTPMSATLSFGPIQLAPPEVTMLIATDPLSSTLTYTVSWDFEKPNSRQVITVGAEIPITSIPYSNIFSIEQGTLLSESTVVSQVVDLSEIPARPINGSAYAIDNFGKKGEAVAANTYFDPIPTLTPSPTSTIVPTPTLSLFATLHQEMKQPIDGYRYLIALGIIIPLLWLLTWWWRRRTQKGIKLVPSAISAAPIHALLYRENRQRNSEQIIAIRPDRLWLGSERIPDELTAAELLFRRHYLPLAPEDTDNSSVILTKKPDNAYELQELTVGEGKVSKRSPNWTRRLRQGERLVLGMANFAFIPLRSIASKSDSEQESQ